METDWLLQLATSGATTLIGAAATDAWQQARLRFVRLLGRGDDNRQALAARRLDELAAAVEQADVAERDAVRQQLLPAWQTRLSDLLEEDAAARDVLRELRDELQAQLPAAQQHWVMHVTASAPGASAYGAMGSGNVYHYSAGSPADLSGEQPRR